MGTMDHKQYEYREDTVYDSRLQDFANREGRNGWRVVSVMRARYHGNFSVLLEREKGASRISIIPDQPPTLEQESSRKRAADLASRFQWNLPPLELDRLVKTLDAAYADGWSAAADQGCV